MISFMGTDINMFVEGLRSQISNVSVIRTSPRKVLRDLTVFLSLSYSNGEMCSLSPGASVASSFFM